MREKSVPAGVCSLNQFSCELPNEAPRKGRNGVPSNSTLYFSRQESEIVLVSSYCVVLLCSMCDFLNVGEPIEGWGYTRASTYHSSSAPLVFSNYKQGFQISCPVSNIQASKVLVEIRRTVLVLTCRLGCLRACTSLLNLIINFPVNSPATLLVIEGRNGRREPDGRCAAIS